MTLAIIPARGGSKGIPRKNLLPIAGKPLIVWTIEQALATNSLHVVVSTEDAEIADVSRAAGADVIRRPIELAQDTTATEPVVEHAIATPGGNAAVVGALDLSAALSMATVSASCRSCAWMLHCRRNRPVTRWWMLAW